MRAIGYEFIKFVIHDGVTWTSRMAEREIAPAQHSAVSSFERMDACWLSLGDGDVVATAFRSTTASKREMAIMDVMWAA